MAIARDVLARDAQDNKGAADDQFHIHETIVCGNFDVALSRGRPFGISAYLVFGLIRIAVIAAMGTGGVEVYDKMPTTTTELASRRRITTTR